MKFISFLFLMGICNAGFSQQYWQQQTDYKIEVSLNDTLKTLDGNVELHYTNHSPDTLHFIWFHLWPNAYKNDRTAFSEQLLQNGQTSFYFSDESAKGYINQLQFNVNDIPSATEDHPVHQDIIKLILPHPLLPGATAIITTPFHVKLPFAFSRGGFVGNQFKITQWYPKPAVYDHKGWHPMPYLDLGEYYSEIGSFRVAVTVPKNYKVAATGTMVETSHQNDLKTEIYVEHNIHDFAWFAGTNIQHSVRSIKLKDKSITLNLYHRPETNKTWQYALDVMEDAVIKMSEWVGAYPYNTLSVVEDQGGGDGGMEYPTITLVTGFADTATLHSVIRHEIIHNWFYGILATNERRYPWMDEGMTSYYDKRFLNADTANAPTKKNGPFSHLTFSNAEASALNGLYHLRADQPLSTSSEDLTNYNYMLVVYEKGAQWMEKLAKEMGQQKFDILMKSYFSKWKFRHPYPADFKHLADSIHGSNLDNIFTLLDKTGPIQKPLTNPFNIKLLTGLSEKSSPNTLYVFPVAGYNKYDKGMIGMALHNYGVPLTAFRYMAIPMYAFGSKQLTGLAHLSYHKYGREGSQFTLSLAGSRFHKDAFTETSGKREVMDYLKVVPAARYTFKKKSPRSTAHRYIQYKYYHIRETNILFLRDSINNIFVPTYPKNVRYIQELKLQIENNRKLYPYQLQLIGEQGEGFTKAHATANYFLNFPKGGGLHARFFGGKFFYTGNKTNLSNFRLSRYHYNMTGANGYEDYLYGDYFIGRNEFDGFASQQIKIKDGGFKVRTDLLASKVGRSDDWLMALNLCSTIPNNINPLSILPFKIPLRVFADVGTHAEAWSDGNTGGKFLFDAGLQITLLGIVNVYAPLIYSKVYRDYFKSTIPDKRFWKTVSFSIDIENIPLRKQLPQLSW